MRNSVALLPLRSLHDGKQRLRHVLPSPERAALVEHLFRHTLDAVRAAGVADAVYAVSPDPAVAAWARQWNMDTIVQPVPGLNEGLEHARRTLLAEHRVDALLVVLPDLPLLTAGDIVALAERSTPRSVVLAPDHHGHGTNALLVRPAAALPFAFGANSFERHCTAAYHAQLAVHVCSTLGTAFDVDMPDDFDLMHERAGDRPMDADQYFHFSVSPCFRGA